VVLLVCHQFTGCARRPSSPPSATSTSHPLPLVDKLCLSALRDLTCSLSVRAHTEWSNPSARRDAKSTTTLCCLSSRVAAIVSGHDLGRTTHDLGRRPWTRAISPRSLSSSTALRGPRLAGQGERARVRGAGRRRGWLRRRVTPSWSASSSSIKSMRRARCPAACLAVTRAPALALARGRFARSSAADIGAAAIAELETLADLVDASDLAPRAPPAPDPRPTSGPRRSSRGERAGRVSDSTARRRGSYDPGRGLVARPSSSAGKGRARPRKAAIKR